MILVQSLTRPFGRGARVGIEPVEVEAPGHRLLMITVRDRLGAPGDHLDAGNRVGAVADEVSEAEERVGSCRRVRQHGFERFEITVNVREHRVPHRRAQEVGRSSLWMRSSKPLMKRLDSFVPNFLAISMASLMATFGGTSSVHRSS